MIQFLLCVNSFRPIGSEGATFMSAMGRQAAISLQIARQARTSPNAQRRPAMKLVWLRLSSELLSSNHPVHSGKCNFQRLHIRSPDVATRSNFE